MNENSSSSVGRWIDCAASLGREHADGHDGDRAEQRDAGAVELQERQPAEDHPEVDDDEDGDDGGGHREARALQAAKIACMRRAPSVSAAGPGWRMSADLISCSSPSRTAGTSTQPGRAATRAPPES